MLENEAGGDATTKPADVAVEMKSLLYGIQFKIGNPS